MRRHFSPRGERRVAAAEEAVGNATTVQYCVDTSPAALFGLNFTLRDAVQLFLRSVQTAFLQLNPTGVYIMPVRT